MALLHVISNLKNTGIIKADFLCAHINHQLRADQADKDEDFVVAEAGKLEIETVTKRICVRGFAE